RAPHSFPTRRSSDLLRRLPLRGGMVRHGNLSRSHLRAARRGRILRGLHVARRSGGGVRLRKAPIEAAGLTGSAGDGSEASAALRSEEHTSNSSHVKI